MINTRFRKIFFHRRIVLCFCLLLSFTQGCADLKAIQDFANISAESAEYTGLVDNYVSFPERQKRYQAPDRHPQLHAMAQERAKQKTALLLRHEIIHEYMEALGSLAADEIVDHSDEISELSQALQGGIGTSPEETEAFGKITGTLTKVASDKWRQGKLKQLIEQSNDPLQTIIRSLQQIVREAFGGDRQTEQATMRNYYMTLIMESNDPAGKAALQEWQEYRLAQSAKRTKGIQTYSELLTEISEGHQQLYDQRYDLNPNVLRQIRNSAEEMKELLAIINNM